MGANILPPPFNHYRNILGVLEGTPGLQQAGSEPEGRDHPRCPVLHPLRELGEHMGHMGSTKVLVGLGSPGGARGIHPVTRG